MEYPEFIAQKHVRYQHCGFEPGTLPNSLKDWQAAVVKVACRAGRFGLFERPGLGKTIQQLAWADQVVRQVEGKVLILAPLVVASQTVREAEKFGIDEVKYSRDGRISTPITITNYEHMDKFNPSDFAGVVLDESSILAFFMGKTKRKIVAAFANTEYRLVASATPARNDLMELLNQADFLGIMSSNEALARWFINDTMNMGKYKLLPHAAKYFWAWVSSWAVCMDSPADIGYDGSEFQLPGLKRIEHVIDIKHDFSDGKLFADDRPVSATDLYSELRETAEPRAMACAETVNGSDDGWIVWCNTNKEAEILQKKISGSVNVYGSMKVEDKEKAIIDFLAGKIKVIVTKPSIMGFGLNFQHIHKQAFVGLSYSYEQFYQAECRLHRFGQKFPVESHLFMSPKERKTYEKVMEKAQIQDRMRQNMVNDIAVFSEIEKGKEGLRLMLDYERKEWKGDNWTLMKGDSCQEIETITDDTIDFCLHSPPFSSLYIYSDSAMDMGNCADDEEFFQHYDFLIGKLYRKMRPGRLVAIHCKQLVDYKGRDGRAGLRDFRGEIIRHFEAGGFKYHSEVCIWKDPVIEMQRTKANGLLHKTTKKDGSFNRQGLPDYLVIMRKWPEEGDSGMVVPVERPHGFSRYIGEDHPERRRQEYQWQDPETGNVFIFAVEWDKESRKWHCIAPDNIPERRINEAIRWAEEGFSIHVWQRYASPVWWDIQQTNVLNKNGCRDENDEKHICPLQIGVIERAIHLWTNPGELVYTPFAGIGSELYGAIKQGRRALGHELKETYCKNAVKFLDDFDNRHIQIDLKFD